MVSEHLFTGYARFSVLVLGATLSGLHSLAFPVRMVQIAQLPQPLCYNFPCGDANHNGRFEVYGTRSMTEESLVVFEYVGDNEFTRSALSTIAHAPTEFGDGDGDDLMELVVGSTSDRSSAVILESPDAYSFPADSVWGTFPHPAANHPYPKFMDLDRDGRRELAIQVENYGVHLYENAGDNQYELVAVLSESLNYPAGDFDFGDLDGDSLTELVIGSMDHRIYVFEATGNDNEYVLAARCSTLSHQNYNVAVAHDMDRNGRPEFLAIGTWFSGGQYYVRLMIYEAIAGSYAPVWEQARLDFFRGMSGNPFSVGDIDGDSIEEFAVHTGRGVALFKCTGPHEYAQVWQRDSIGSYERLFDVNRDGRAEVIFDGPRGTEIWEDTEGLAVAEMAKPKPALPVMVRPTIARLGMPVQFSGISPNADIEVHSLDGRLVTQAEGVGQPNWTWSLRDQAGNLVPAGTYFAVIRSKERLASLKLCIVK
jgi:hypothetical protein